MTIGAFAALWLAVIPMEVCRGVLVRILGKSNPMTLAPVMVLTLVALAGGAQWFRKLFYSGMLWGYRSDKDGPDKED